MTRKKSYPDSETYFCTFTCLNWINLVEITNLYPAIYDWFNILIKNGHQLAGFVLMPNHVHLLVHVDASHGTVNKILANGKRF